MKLLGRTASLLSSFDLGPLKKIPDEVVLTDKWTPIPAGHLPRYAIIVCERVEPEQVVSLAMESGIHQIVQTSNADPVGEILAAARLAQDIGRFLKQPLVELGLPAEPLKLQFRNASNKDIIKKEIVDYIAAIPPLKTVNDAVLQVADEIMMNALFDAPVHEESKERQHYNLERNKDVKLPVGKAAELFLVYSESKLVIGCRDPYGSISEKKFMNRLQACYTPHKQAEVNLGPGGAGIGCRMIFENCTSLYVVAEKGKATLTCGIMPLGIGLRAMQKMSKNLHVVIA